MISKSHIISFSIAVKMWLILQFVTVFQGFKMITQSALPNPTSTPLTKITTNRQAFKGSILNQDKNWKYIYTLFGIIGGQLQVVLKWAGSFLFKQHTVKWKRNSKPTKRKKETILQEYKYKTWIKINPAALFFGCTTSSYLTNVSFKSCDVAFGCSFLLKFDCKLQRQTPASIHVLFV